MRRILTICHSRVLKERKKLNFQVDSLTRKVKALEKELAEMTAKPAPKTKEPSTSQPPAQAPVPSRTSSTSTRKSASTNTRPSSSSSARTSAASDSPYLLQNARSLASTSTSSSSLQRTKTPEPKARREVKPAPPSAVQVQQPEPVTIGKKRRAPDDFDACESVPAQVFTPESVPSKASENQTPRSRKATTANKGGFTPVRSRPPSKDPVGRTPAPTLTLTSTTAITDVTNGTAQRPATQPAPPTTQTTQPPVKARSWLRNVKPPATSR